MDNALLYFFVEVDVGCCVERSTVVVLCQKKTNCRWTNRELNLEFVFSRKKKIDAKRSWHCGGDFTLRIWNFITGPLFVSRFCRRCWRSQAFERNPLLLAEGNAHLNIIENPRGFFKINEEPELCQHICYVPIKSDAFSRDISVNNWSTFQKKYLILILQDSFGRLNAHSLCLWMQEAS